MISEENEMIKCDKCGNDKFVVQESEMGSLYVGCSECGNGNIFGGGVNARDIILILKGGKKTVEHKTLRCPSCRGNKFIEEGFETNVDYPGQSDVITKRVYETMYTCMTCYAKRYSDIYGSWYDIDDEQRAELKQMEENTMSEVEKIDECNKIQKGQRRLHPYCAAPDGLMKYCRRAEGPGFYDRCRYSII